MASFRNLNRNVTQSTGEKRPSTQPLPIQQQPKRFKPEPSPGLACDYPTATCGDMFVREVKNEAKATFGKHFYACSCQGKGQAFVWADQVVPGKVYECKATGSVDSGEQSSSILAEELTNVKEELKKLTGVVSDLYDLIKSFSDQPGEQ